MTHIRILIVGNSLQTCLGYGASLPSPRYDLTVCSSFEAGADMLSKGDFDFVVADQGGPKFMARMILNRAARQDPRVPVLVVAPLFDLQSHLESMELGAVDYLEEPEPEDIQQVIEKHLRRNSTHCSGMFNPLFERQPSALSHAAGKH